MIINPRDAEPVGSGWPTVIDCRTGVVKRWRVDGYEITLHMNPQTRSGSDLIYIPSAATLLRDGTPILSIQVEEEDYRSLALSLGYSDRRMREETGSEDRFGNRKIYLYGDTRREDLGSVTVEQSRLDEHLVEWLLDSANLLGELVPVN